MSNIQISERKVGLPTHAADEAPLQKPAWLKVRLPTRKNFFLVAEILRKGRLHTICQSAKCPNISECWEARTATFLILGETCTRECGFCAVPKGRPLPPSLEEPGRVAEAVSALGLDYVVVTSVTRDDLSDGGASVFAETIRETRAARPGIKVEVLIPDFQGNPEALATVIESGPDILNHNLETAESCYPLIHRPEENYRRSLGVLRLAKEMGTATKSGLMIGLGESAAEIEQTFADLRAVGCDLLTIGQYLRPSRDNIPVQKYYTPGEFEELKREALESGFREAAAGPLVRSSYQALRMYFSLEKGVSKEPCVI